MSGYGFENRVAPARTCDYYHTYRDTGAVHPKHTKPFSYSSKKETLISFRSNQRGIPVPEHVADPYGYFLKNGAAIDIKDLQKKHSYPKGHGIEALTGTSVPKNPPHVDNGHAFVKTSVQSWTTAMKSDYKFPGFSTTYFHSGPTWAVLSEINSAHRHKALFGFSGSNRYRFGKISTDLSQDLIGYGQKAIGTLAPTRPDISLAGILGELREGLPSLIGMAAFKARANAIKRGKSRTLQSAGSEWVNLQFAVIPLMSDIKSTYDALMSVTERLINYQADASNGVRRRMSFPVKDEIVHFSEGQCSTGFLSVDPSHLNEEYKWGGGSHSAYYPIGRRSTLTQQTSDRIWFSGSFTYFIPVGKDLSSNIDRYVALGNKLFGSSLSPEVLWQLAPWSWLVDWFYDIGATISAFERIKDDNLVVNYGYVMGTSKKTATHRIVTPSPLDSRLKDVSSVTSSIRKERMRANPYGFSATKSAEFTPMKWSILAALGFSKFL